jgi:hypothetical protein
MGAIPVKSLAEVFAFIKDKYGPRPRVAIVPEAGYYAFSSAEAAISE